jgi:polysaccharide pyruvyl transferase WcaK-like protein
MTTGPLSPDRARPRVALIAHVGTTNHGDEAILASTLDALATWQPAPAVTVFSIDPPDTTRRHGVASLPLRRVVARGGHEPAPRPTTRAATPAGAPSSGGVRSVLRRVPGLRSTVEALRAVGAALAAVKDEVPFLVRSWRALRGTRLVVVAGSNQLEDWFGGAWGFPYTIYTWVFLARLVGARVVFLSVGSGPLGASLSRSFCRRALGRSELSSFRDAESEALMRSCGFEGASSVQPDLAFGLAPREPPARTPGAPLRVLINVFPYKDPSYDPHVKGAGDKFERYLATLAALTSGLLERGHEVVFACSQRADRRVIGLVQARLPAGQGSRTVMYDPQSVDELRGILGGADFVIATRFHGILLSLLAARPVVALCYQSKSRNLMASVGLERFAVDLTDSNAAEILARFEELRARAPELKDALGERVARTHAAVLAQFDAVARLAGFEPPSRSVDASLANAGRDRP